MGFDAISLSELFESEILLVADGDAGLIVDKCIIVEQVNKKTKMSPSPGLSSTMCARPILIT